MTRLINSWIHDTPIKEIALKALHVMPALLLQKPSKNSKSKDHLNCLERRLDLWKEGKINELFDEGKTIQDRLKTDERPNDIVKISKNFKQQMQKGNINGALKVLTNNMSNGILPLTDETLRLLDDKHPDAKETVQQAMLQGPIQTILPILYDVIDEELIKKAAIRTRGGSGPSGLDADGWRRILVSSCFGTATSDLRKSIAEFVKKLCTTNVLTTQDESSLESFVACRLIPLNKNPGLRPIGVGEVLRRISGKVVMMISRQDVMKAAGSLQVCAGQEAGAEAAIHAVYDIFKDQNTEAVLLIDAENAFNAINRKAMLHNISIICPIISKYITNCYNTPARLFVIGGKEISSREGTTQGDPTAMAAYALGVTPLLNDLLEFTTFNKQNSKEIAFADDFTVAGKITDIKSYWDHLNSIAPLFGYYPKASKSHLIVKSQFLEVASITFANTKVNLTSEGMRHLGAVIGSRYYKEKFVNELVAELDNQLRLLSKIAETEPQSAYTAFVSGFKNKLTYFVRTIPDIGDLLLPLEHTLRQKFIPAVTGGQLCSDNERILLSLPTRFGGLNIPLFEESSKIEYENSRRITKHLTKLITDQDPNYTVNFSELSKLKREIKAEKEERYKHTLQNLEESFTKEQKRLNEINREKGVSNWLLVLPMVENGFDLTKQQFWDSVRLRYGWPLANLPTTCACGSSFTVQHSMSCKKGGFINIRHNDLRDLTSKLLSEVCHDVEIEPSLLPLTGERMEYRTAIENDEARVDIRARGFWIRGQQAFTDVRVFDPNARRYLNSSLTQCYITNEKEKKRNYNQRILQVDQGSFTPLVFSIYGGMGRECQSFYSRLGELLSEKRNVHKSVMMHWIRSKLSYALLKSCLLCLRGSRSHNRNVTMVEHDIVADYELSSIR